MEQSLWMEPQKPSRVPVINGGVMGWVLNQCKAEEEAGGGRRGGLKCHWKNLGRIFIFT